MEPWRSIDLQKDLDPDPEPHPAKNLYEVLS